MEKSGAKAYLVNTGWNGTGKRISIKDTRGIIDAILDGSILKAPTKEIRYFDFEVPTELPGVDSKILDPLKASLRNGRLAYFPKVQRATLHDWQCYQRCKANDWRSA